MTTRPQVTTAFHSMPLAAVFAASLFLAAATSFTAAPIAAPIADAAMKGDVAAVRALIAQGEKVSAAQGDGMTALHWAAERGDSAMADILLRARADLRR